MATLPMVPVTGTFLTGTPTPRGIGGICVTLTPDTPGGLVKLAGSPSVVVMEQQAWYTDNDGKLDPRAEVVASDNLAFEWPDFTYTVTITQHGELLGSFSVDAFAGIPIDVTAPVVAARRPKGIKGDKGDAGTIPLPVALDLDGVPYPKPDGTHQVVIDTTGVPVIMSGQSVGRQVGLDFELGYEPTPVYSEAEVDELLDTAVAGHVGDQATATRIALDAWMRDWRGKAAPAGVYNVHDYGAKGDDSTDDRAAIQAAIDAAVAGGGGVVFAPLRYVVDDELNIYRPNSPRIDLVIQGVDPLTSFIRSRFTGAGKALLNGRAPTAKRCSPITLRNIQLGTTTIWEGPNPVLFEVEGWGESRLDNVRFGSTNNTVLRACSVQNVRGRGITSFYGGKHFLYRATDAARFTVTAATRTITADRDVFVTKDAGSAFFVFPIGNVAARIMYRLGEVIGPREVRISSSSTEVLDVTSAKGGFEAARASMTAGSAVLTADANCFSADDVGRVLVVRGAKAGSWGPAVLRSRIVGYTSATTVTLADAATRTVTLSPFAQPVFDLWTDKVRGNGLGDTSTDLRLDAVQIENYAGLSLSVIDSLQFHLTGKMHGEHDPVDLRASTGAIWMDDVAGTYEGEFDGASLSDARMYLCNMNDTLLLPSLTTRRVGNEPIFLVDEMQDTGALIDVAALVSYRDDPRGILGHVTDANVAAGRDPKLVFTGPVVMVTGSTPPRIYHGNGLWMDTAGRMTMTSPNGTEYRVGVTNAGTLSITALEGE